MFQLLHARRIEVDDRDGRPVGYRRISRFPDGFYETIKTNGQRVELNNGLLIREVDVCAPDPSKFRNVFLDGGCTVYAGHTFDGNDDFLGFHYQYFTTKLKRDKVKNKDNLRKVKLFLIMAEEYRYIVILLTLHSLMIVVYFSTGCLEDCAEP